MKTYNATIGIYVRAYARITFEAETDEEATNAAIAQFKKDPGYIDEFDWDNTAHPSIASLTSTDDPDEYIVDGHDFALTAEDYIDYAARDLLTACEAALDDITNTVNYDQKDPQTMNTVDLLTKAIAKAKGEK